MRYVFYHGGCFDGFGAAFCAWKKFGDTNTKYVPVAYGKALEVPDDAIEVFILDYSIPKAELEALAQRSQVTLLDHHKTAQAMLADVRNTENLTVVFDMSRSGALITYNHLFPGEPVPRLIQHISDRDLWQFKLEGTKEVHQALVARPMDFKLWDDLKVDELIAEGQALLRQYDQLVENVCEKAYLADIAGYTVPVVNTSIAWSEVGNTLCKKFGPKAPFAASFTVLEDSIMWSLRSVGDFDVSEIAKKFGGGGHKNAAGFKAPRY